MWESIKILDIMAPNSTSAHMRDTIFQGHPPNTGTNALKTDPKTENYQVANQKYSNNRKIRFTDGVRYQIGVLVQRGKGTQELMVDMTKIRGGGHIAHFSKSWYQRGPTKRSQDNEQVT